MTGAELAAFAASGPWVFENLVTGKCMDLVGTGAGSTGGYVIQYTCNYTSADNQLWQMNLWDPERFTISNVKDGLCIDPPGVSGSISNGSALRQYQCFPGPSDNQLFRLWWVPAAGGYQIINDKSVKCIDVVGPGTGGNSAGLVMYGCLDDDDHYWNHIPV
ncbi:RICIN domain-containing protein [Polymorphospora sp. NPDC051019]|uniref:RICIN domain-containing protein n=1 Tax=Polymorphospora sp. NPDC051019 TaxID=3155725 RepID=UPI00343E2E5E